MSDSNDNEESTSYTFKKTIPFLSYSVLIGALLSLVAVASGVIYSNQAKNNLSTTGNGVPTVVLVNTASCIGCETVEKRARSALGGFDNVRFQIADTCTDSGRQFAEYYHADPVSILLLDGAGVNVRTIKGLQSESIYHALIQRWLIDQCKQKREVAIPENPKRVKMIGT